MGYYANDKDNLHVGCETFVQTSWGVSGCLVTVRVSGDTRREVRGEVIGVNRFTKTAYSAGFSLGVLAGAVTLPSTPAEARCCGSTCQQKCKDTHHIGGHTLQGCYNYWGGLCKKPAASKQAVGSRALKPGTSKAR